MPDALRTAFAKALAAQPLDDREIAALIKAMPERLAELLPLAAQIRERHLGNTVSFCAIVNAKSGNCPEDCAFCAQSAHHATNAPRYGFLSPQEIAKAASAMKARGARRFSVVTSGKALDEADFARLKAAVAAVAEQGLAPDVSAGLLDAGQIRELQAVGLAGVHHNLETSRRFFPSICTTHAFDEDVQAVRTASEAGAYVCSGGLFGLGEGWDDRVDLALTLRGLCVHSVPINFLTPIPGTPLEHRPLLAPEEALGIIVLFRFLLPDRHVRICGGRQAVLGEGSARQALSAGASALMLGDFLTTPGGSAEEDLAAAAALGLVPE